MYTRAIVYHVYKVKFDLYLLVCKEIGVMTLGAVMSNQPARFRIYLHVNDKAWIADKENAIFIVFFFSS